MKIPFEYKFGACALVVVMVFFLLMAKIPSPPPRQPTPVEPIQIGATDTMQDAKIYQAIFEPCSKVAQSSMMVEACQTAAKRGSAVVVAWDGTAWKEVFK
ncbi:hypothetical protein [Pseudomonas helleri]|uniref:hypothetical protein n=1 Tax=Pseudomonas helleri TaxID=1608996 RepID=UPI0024324CA6|nr:hypothetical protein [Pseudomonas helleri]